MIFITLCAKCSFACSMQVENLQLLFQTYAREKKLVSKYTISLHITYASRTLVCAQSIQYANWQIAVLYERCDHTPTRVLN